MEIQDYCNSSSYNIQMEKIVGKLRTNPGSVLLQEGCATVCFSSGDQTPTTAFLQVALVKSLLLPTPLLTVSMSLEYISLGNTLCLPPSSNINVPFC